MNRNNLAGFIFISPWIIGFLLFSGAPVLYSFAISAFRWNLISTPTFIGFDNYITLFKDPLFYQSIKVTLLTHCSAYRYKLLLHY